METMEAIETPQLFLKPFTAGLVEKPLSVMEREVDWEGFRAKTVDIETAPATRGKVDFIELLLTIHNILAAGSLSKEDYDETMSYIAGAIAGNESGREARMVVIRKEDNMLFGLVSMFCLDEEIPRINLWTNCRADFHGNDPKKCGREAVHALLRRVWTGRPFQHLRWTMEKREPSLPPDTLTVYEKDNPDKTYLAHITIGGAVSTEVYEPPETPPPIMREICIECGGGLTLLLEIMLEQNTVDWAEERRNWSAKTDAHREWGDTAEEVIKKISAPYKELLTGWNNA